MIFPQKIIHGGAIGSWHSEFPVLNAGIIHGVGHSKGAAGLSPWE